MARAPDPKSTPAAQQYDSPLGCLLRLFWMAGGNALLLFLAAGIFEKSPRHISFLDGLYWGVVASLVLARFLDIRYCRGQTSSCEPATLGHWRRYALLVVGLSSAVWGVARLLAWFLTGAE
jgi:hypothetical protein